MSARDTILLAVRSVQRGGLPYPANNRDNESRLPVPQCVDRLREAFTAAGAAVVDARRSELSPLVSQLSEGMRSTLSAVPGVRGTVVPTTDVNALASLDLFIAGATLGVAESGAVWVPQSRTAPRAALFLAEHVLIALDRRAVVWDLHDAYARLDVRSEAFGTFVAGPSKTADIEQSLVIGAHGPKRFTLVLLEEETLTRELGPLV